jgi:hypothetical protein
MRSWILLTLAACAPQNDTPVTEAAPAAAVQAVDRASGLSVTFANPRWVTTAFGERLELTGRANRDLVGTFSFVPDDAFGEATLVDARTFTVAWNRGSEVNTALSGLPLLVHLDLADGTTATASVTVDLRTHDLGGARPIGVVEPLRPVLIDDPISNLRYRLRFTTQEADRAAVRHPSAAEAEPEGTFLWKVDWTYDDLVPLLASGRDRVDLVAWAGGARLTRRLRFEPRIAAAALTRADPYDTWPPTCDLDVDACLSALPDGTNDFGECGAYRPVQLCATLDACWYAPESPLALASAEEALAETRTAILAYNESCAGVGDWCSMAWTASYARTTCPDEPATAARLAELAAAADGSRTDTTQGVLFGRSNSPVPEEVLAAIEADYGAPVTGGLYVTESVPCPNCTEWTEWIVLDLPEADRVVVLTAVRGWDS